MNRLFGTMAGFLVFAFVLQNIGMDMAAKSMVEQQEIRHHHPQNLEKYVSNLMHGVTMSPVSK
jgi:hypothetical protein